MTVTAETPPSAGPPVTDAVTVLRGTGAGAEKQAAFDALLRRGGAAVAQALSGRFVPPEDALDAEERQRLEEAIAQLDPDQRELLEARRQGRTLRETAETRGRGETVGQMDRILRNAITRLKELLG